MSQQLLPISSTFTRQCFHLSRIKKSQKLKACELNPREGQDAVQEISDWICQTVDKKSRRGRRQVENWVDRRRNVRSWRWQRGMEGGGQFVKIEFPNCVVSKDR
jgi:hypothetical protein